MNYFLIILSTISILSGCGEEEDEFTWDDKKIYLAYLHSFIDDEFLMTTAAVAFSYIDDVPLDKDIPLGTTMTLNDIPFYPATQSQFAFEMRKEIGPDSWEFSIQVPDLEPVTFTIDTTKPQFTMPADVSLSTGGDFSYVIPNFDTFTENDYLTVSYIIGSGAESVEYLSDGSGTFNFSSDKSPSQVVGDQVKISLGSNHVKMFTETTPHLRLQYSYSSRRNYILR